ncbi:MAG TPA: hypothetical protein PLK08_00815 [Phycisphaerae bacterium]|nr:hypothetical protein [Phycisphaerae bacterium]
MQKTAQQISLPPGTPDWITLGLIAETIDTWQPYYPKSLTPADAVEIIQSMGKLMYTLQGKH